MGIFWSAVTHLESTKGGKALATPPASLPWQEAQFWAYRLSPFSRDGSPSSLKGTSAGSSRPGSISLIFLKSPVSSRCLSHRMVSLLPVHPGHLFVHTYYLLVPFSGHVPCMCLFMPLFIHTHVCAALHMLLHAAGHHLGDGWSPSGCASAAFGHTGIAGWQESNRQTIRPLPPMFCRCSAGNRRRFPAAAAVLQSYSLNVPCGKKQKLLLPGQAR